MSSSDCLKYLIDKLVENVKKDSDSVTDLSTSFKKNLSSKFKVLVSDNHSSVS